MAIENTFTDSANKPEYEAIDTKQNMRPDCDVKMDTDPAYQATRSMAERNY